MKRILQLLCLLLIPSLLWGQTANVTKTPGSNLIKESLVIGSGKSLTITGTGTFSDQGGTLAAQRNALAPAQALSFNGTAAPTVTLGAIGTSDFTAVIVANLATVSGDQCLIGATAATGTDRLGVIISGGKIVFNSGISTNVESAAVVLAGVSNVIAIVRSGNTLYYSLNGGTLTSLGSCASLNITETAARLGYWSSNFQLIPSGTIRLLGIDTIALTAAEVLQLYQTGSWPSSHFNNASNTAINTSSFLDGIAGTTGFVALGGTFSGASATGFSATSIAPGAACSGSLPAFTVSVGQRIRVTYTATITSGTPKVALFNSAVSGIGATALDLVAGTNTIEITATSASTTARIAFYLLAAGDFSVSNVSITRLGLLVAPDPTQPGNGLLWLDTSGNGAHTVCPASTTAWAIRGNGQNNVRGTTSTNGNQQLFGAATLDASTRIVAIYARARTGAPTVKFGTASAGNELGTATAISTAWTPIPLGATTVTSAVSSVWVNSTTTDVVETNVITSPLSF